MIVKMMIKKTGLAFLGLVIGMAFMGASSVATLAAGGYGEGNKCQKAKDRAQCERCCSKKKDKEKNKGKTDIEKQKKEAECKQKCAGKS